MSGAGGRGEGARGAAPRALALMDGVSRGLLLAWAALGLAGLAFGFAVGATAVDAAAWGAFGGAALLSGLPRWLSGASDGEAIGPLRLWAAACAAALLFCMAGSFVAAPRVRELRALIASGGSPGEGALSKKLARAEGYSAQFLCVRVALAVGLALGAKRLPGGGGGGRRAAR